VNQLELCQFANRYIQGGDALPGTAPVTVVGQTGYLYEQIKNVADAYKSIQNEQDQWRFMQKQGSFALPSATRVLTNADMVVQVPDYETIRADLFGAGQRYMQIYADSVGPNNETPVIYVDYQTWRGSIDQGPIPTCRPYLFTIRPDEAIEFNSIADQDYHFTCDYQRTLGEFTQVDVGPVLANEQTPIFPARFHEAIAWRAVMFWAGSVEATGKYGFARSEFERIMNDMRNDQLPETVPYYEALYAVNGTWSYR